MSNNTQINVIIKLMPIHYQSQPHIKMGENLFGMFLMLYCNFPSEEKNSKVYTIFHSVSLVDLKFRASQAIRVIYKNFVKYMWSSFGNANA